MFWKDDSSDLLCGVALRTKAVASLKSSRKLSSLCEARGYISVP